jgi:brefeldin A-inhibited guanine nucleotide-exchange protein
VQPHSKEIFAIIIDFLNGSLEVDDNSQIHIDNVSELDKQNFTKLVLDSAKWEKYGNLHNENFKEFLKQIISEYYIDESLEEKAKKIAHFLQLSHHIDSNKVIDIVGLAKPINSQILKEYISCINFDGKDIVQAFRLLFINFLMNAEAQVIDRVIEEFCAQYFSTLPLDTVFKDKGVLHTFSYAIIMLQTDLHRPTVIDKMTVEGFIKNVKGINNGENLPEAFLRDCYNNIKGDEMKTLSTRDLTNEENVSHGNQLYSYNPRNLA